MRFSDEARLALVEAKESFGSYVYNDKGPDEVMDVRELFLKIRTLSVDKAIDELVHLAQRTDCPLDPSRLAFSIASEMEEDEKFSFVFDDDSGKYTEFFEAIGY